MTVTEPVRLQATGAGQFQFHAWTNQTFTVQKATNLVEWTQSAAIAPQGFSLTNRLGTAQFTDPATS